jgi:predicted chitinase
MRASEFLTELFNKPGGYTLEWDDQFGPKEIHARAYDRQGQYIDINFVPVRDNVTDIEFSKMDNYEETGQGDEVAIFATVLQAIKRYLQDYQPKIIVFSGKGGRDNVSRANLYQKLINRFAKQYGYQQFDLNKLSPEARKQISASGSTGFVLRKATQQSVNESKIIDYNGIKLNVSIDGANIDIRALSPDGRQLGYVVFDRDGKDLVADDLAIEERSKGQGIAKVMYDYVKELGFNVKRSYDQTQAGKAFWDKNKGEEGYVWEAETYQPPELKVGDTILKGKFKNSPAKIKGFTKDKHNQPVLKTNKGEVQLFKPRISKLANEEINPDIRNAEFEHEQEIGDYRYTANTHKSPSGLSTFLLIKCYNGPALIARADFEVKGMMGNRWLESENTMVADQYKNKGIASTMYAYAKMLGNDIKPSPSQSDAGKDMWKSWEKSGADQHLMKETDIDEGVVDWAKKGAAAGAIALGALGAGGADAKPIKPTMKPTISQPAQSQQTRQNTVQRDNTPGYNVLSKNPQNEIVMLKTAKAAGMKGTELAQFMAQMKHESWDFDRMKEKAQPGVNGYFAKRYDPKFSPKTAKILGNKHVGDGEKYHGRGFIQLTGRDNYRMASEALGIDLINKPELAAKPEVAAKVALWYWTTRVKPYVQNFADTKAVTMKINPAGRGLADRHENFKDYMRII